MSGHERTYIRDEALIRRHHMWGLSCSAVDLGFTMVEYNARKPVAIVEYRPHGSKPVDLSHPMYRTLKWMADKCGIPFFIVLYKPGVWWFVVHPANRLAITFFNGSTHFSEYDYVQKLYELRGFALEKDFIPLKQATIRSSDKLCAVQPENVMTISCLAVVPEADSWPVHREMSLRHREWGLNCPAVDLDYLLIDFNHCVPVCILEYKYMTSPTNDSNTTATLRLAEHCGIPYFGAQYNNRAWWFIVSAYRIGQGIVPGDEKKRYNEQSFREFLYELRDRAVAKNIKSTLAKLATDEPPEWVE